VSACLKRAGHAVSVLNPNHSVEPMDELLRKAIDLVRPDVIGFGGMSFHLADMKSMVSVARAARPEAKILLGGPVLTNQPRLTMTVMPEVDFGVVGEGEHTSVELAATLAGDGDVAAVRGLILRGGGSNDGLIVTPARPVEEDLDSLPSVDLEGMGMDIYLTLHRPGNCAPALIADENTRVMPLLTSRGCPYSCTFCCHESAGRRYRLRSLDHVFAELEWAQATYGVNAVTIYDDLFCPKRSRLEEFCRRIAGMGIRWECSMRAEQIDPDVLKKMKESGCCCIGLGVESMSETVLRSMKKGTTKAQVETALGQVYQAEIGLWSNLIFGDPAETLDTVRESLEWYANHPEFSLRMAFIGYHPGSRIYEEAVAKGVIKNPTAFLTSRCPEVNATAMPADECAKMRILVSRYLQSFGHAGKLVDFDSRNLERLVATCLCPYCGSTAHCHTIKPNPLLLATVNCPKCNRGFRAPVVVRLVATKEAQQQEAVVQDRIDTRAPVAAIESACNKLLALDPTNAHAWVVLFSLAKALGKTVESAILLEHAIYADPYNLALFEKMVEQLGLLGVGPAADKYRKKAEHLRRIGVDRTFFVDVGLPPDQEHSLRDLLLQYLKQSIPVASFPLPNAAPAMACAS